MSNRYYLGVDVGTASARAAVFDDEGALHGMGAHPVQVSRPREDFVEHASEDIWRAVGQAVRGALAAAGRRPEDIRGIGFDATCSLVVLDADDRPVPVSDAAHEHDVRDVMVWMDHRAVEQARRINETRHDVLRYVGGGVSPEMQSPKLLWLKENMPASWRRARRFFDLPDFLAYRATGVDTRSLCTTTCKWTYVASNGGWSASFFQQVGLGDLVEDGFTRIGASVRPMGEKQGLLRERAARDLGLVAGIPVAVSIIDAHAGGVGMLGAAGGSVDAPDRLALIGGTSSCHMAVARKPSFVRGIWGPYESAMVPGLWLNEAGQSATGALIDHVIDSHARGAELRRRATEERTTAYALLNARLTALAGERPMALLTRDLHVVADHHGNRSPRADADARGVVCGLKLDDGLDALARLYLATIQAIAYGTREIISALNSYGGYSISTLVACGGDTKNPVFVQEHADATGCRVVLPREPEAVLLGSAMLGAVAAGDRGTLGEAMVAMSGAGAVTEPVSGDVAAHHRRKYAVHQKMVAHQLEYRKLMS